MCTTTERKNNNNSIRLSSTFDFYVVNYDLWGYIKKKKKKIGIGSPALSGICVLKVTKDKKKIGTSTRSY